MRSENESGRRGWAGSRPVRSGRDLLRAQQRSLGKDFEPEEGLQRIFQAIRQRTGSLLVMDGQTDKSVSDSRVVCGMGAVGDPQLFSHFRSVQKLAVLLHRSDAARCDLQT